MTPSADQVAAFQANGGFAPSAVSAVVLGFVFAVVLLWGVWAVRTAYVGWAEHRITERQFLAVVVRFVAMYLVLAFFLRRAPEVLTVLDEHLAAGQLPGEA